MFIRNNLRFNIYAPATIDGVRYPNFLDTQLRASLGITEIPEPEAPEEYLTHPEWWFRTEQDDEPYVVYTRKSDEQIAEIEAAKIPRSVTMRQARLALLGAGLLSTVDAAIDGIEDETVKAAARIEWEYANEVWRESQFVQQLAGGLGLTDEQIDALFTAASQL